MHSPVIGEFFGTMMLIILGCGVVANVLLQQSKGQNSGWIVITMGWAMAVYLGVTTSLHLGGSGHINPAITIALTLFKDFDASLLISYVLAQFGGAIVGSIVVWLAYKKQFDATTDEAAILGVFSNSPTIKSPFYNSITEIIGTFVLTFGALSIGGPVDELANLKALPYALLVLGIGLSLGGPTGYAINPARDLGPRIAHFLLPIKAKGSSDWNYSWIPVVGPIIGACIAVMIYNML